MEREIGAEGDTGKKAEGETGERLKERLERVRGWTPEEKPQGIERILEERTKDRLGWRRLVERLWRDWQIKLRQRLLRKKLTLRAWSWTREDKRILESLGRHYWVAIFEIYPIFIYHHYSNFCKEIYSISAVWSVEVCEHCMSLLLHCSYLSI